MINSRQKPKIVSSFLRMYLTQRRWFEALSNIINRLLMHYLDLHVLWILRWLLMFSGKLLHKRHTTLSSVRNQCAWLDPRGRPPALSNNLISALLSFFARYRPKRLVSVFFAALLLKPFASLTSFRQRTLRTFRRRKPQPFLLLLEQHCPIKWTPDSPSGPFRPSARSALRRRAFVTLLVRSCANSPR